MPFRYKKRTFLNKDLSKSAHIIASVEKTQLGKEGQLWGADASIDIMDCNRKVSLEFGIYSKKEIPESLDKLNKIIEVLLNFQKALQMEADFISTYVEPKKKKISTEEPEIVG